VPIKFQTKLNTLVRSAVLCFLCLSLVSTPVNGKGKYEEGDWVSYSVFRYITSIAMDYDHVYFGTTGGVTRYDRFANHWDLPLTTSDGLPDNWVRDIAYDPERDEIWADTYRGAAYYHQIFGEWTAQNEFPRHLSQSDTAKLDLPDFFTDFGPPTWGDQWITDSHLDKYPISNYLKDDFDDRVWVGTWGLNAGVASLRSLRLKIFRFGLHDKDVKAILIDSDEIWFAGTGNMGPSTGITRYNRKERTWDYYSSQYVPFLSSHQVNVMETDSHYVWFGTQDGLARMKKKDSSWWFYKSFAGLPDDEVTALESDGGHLWIGTTYGLALYDLGADSLTSIQDPLIKNLYVYSILADSDYVWAGTNRGAYTFDKEAQTWYRFVTPDGLLSGQVRSIARLNDENSSSGKDEIWFGTDMGILGYSPVSDKREVYHNQMNFPEVDVIKVACDKKNIWVATTHGVWKLNRITDIWIKYTTDDGLIDNNVQDMVLDGDHIWFGTPQGATRFFWNNPRLVE
jgi:ligand-binding sensor domain-containing protein